ncbi:hypothetical protein WIW50_16945, partial [Flavobacteriaceae bacterium 3-367]
LSRHGAAMSFDWDLAIDKLKFTPFRGVVLLRFGKSCGEQAPPGLSRHGAAGFQIGIWFLTY